MTLRHAADFLALAAARRGHFRLESGYHGSLWIELDALFAAPRRIMPFVETLADRLRGHKVDAVCGPTVGGAFAALLVAQALGVEFYFTDRVMQPRPEGMFQVYYRLPSAFRERVSGKRLAMVDDIMSAGSALRGTYAALQAGGAVPAVAAALLVLGDIGETFFAERKVPVEAVAREPYELYMPGDCPLCATDTPLEDVSDAPA